MSGLKHCDNDGKPFTPRRDAQHQRFCSARCRREWNSKRREDALAAVTPRPIETAPLDTPILLWSVDDQCWVAGKRHEFPGNPTEVKSFPIPSCDESYYFSASHWLAQLPAPGQQQQGD